MTQLKFKIDGVGFIRSMSVNKDVFALNGSDFV